MTQPFKQPDFVRLALAEFPTLREEFESFAGQPSFAGSIFATHLQRAKGDADWDSYERGIRLIERLWDIGDAELDAMLRWNVMKGLDFEGPRGSVAWAYLTPELQRAWQSTRNRLEALSALPSKTKRRGTGRR